MKRKTSYVLPVNVLGPPISLNRIIRCKANRLVPNHKLRLQGISSTGVPLIRYTQKLSRLRCRRIENRQSGLS